jgi:hypothetical protein
MAKWEDYEIALMRLHYAKTPGVLMAHMLGRTRSAVQKKAFQLSLKRIDGHASTPGIVEAGRKRRGRTFSRDHLAALQMATQRREAIRRANRS